MDHAADIGFGAVFGRASLMPEGCPDRLLSASGDLTWRVGQDLALGGIVHRPIRPNAPHLPIGDNPGPIHYHATEIAEFPMVNAVVYTWNTVQPEQGEGVSRRLIPGDGASLKMVSINAGTAAERHRYH